ncbi:Crp/Fnr family transcriptional regulator [Proteiniclasticum ruminis]|uniref:Crp/Fnr family transcriptional regulator n=1 Tax=Proteiniclasticum ruminis TaxID=398199 RepID=UPI0028AFCE16|nr:Crp/Fnr family transcriptional regulator [Proteiniclasticum ruminis]
MKELLEMLPLFQSLTDPERSNYISRQFFFRKDYKKNSVLHFEGEHCTHLEIVLSGVITIDRISEDGTLLTLFELKEQDILGGNLLYTAYPYYPMTASCKTDVTILAIEKENLFEILSTHPVILRSFLSFSNNQASSLSHTVRNYMGQPLREKLLRYFEIEMKKQKRNPFLLPMTKKALAEKMGVQRTSISRELRKMSEAKILRTEKNWIEILD